MHWGQGCCYATSFPGILSLLPSNTSLDLSQSLHKSLEEIEFQNSIED